MVRTSKTEFQKPIVSNEPSGAQGRAKRKAQDEETKKLQVTSAKFFRAFFVPTNETGEELVAGQNGPDVLTSTPTVPDDEDASTSLASDTGHNAVTPTHAGPDAVDLPSGNAGSAADLDTESFPSNSERDPEQIISEVQSESSRKDPEVELNGLEEGSEFKSIDINDPSTWTQDLVLGFKRQILQSTVEYLEEDFKSLKGAFGYWRKHKKGNMANGEYFTRDWLRISKSTDSVFCLPCCMYSSSTSTIKSTWANLGKTGFRDFHHGHQALTTHEQSLSHMDNMRTWKSYLAQLNNPKSISSLSNAEIEKRMSKWRLILRGIVDAVFYLAQNNLALQGHSHDIKDSDCGNFLNLIKLLGKYYTPLANHVDKLKKGSKSYLSPKIQNEFLSLIGNTVKDKVLNQVRQRKYFSILFDTTPDSSHQDQLSQILRTVECSEEGCVIHENFIDFISTDEKTGSGLADEILSKLQKDGLDIQNCKGQGYDNGGNMAGCNKGVQAIITHINPEAQFIPCAAHSLNRVGVNAAENVLEAKLVLGTIQNLYCFFSTSTSRWRKLTETVNLTLKCQSSTRWSSKANAVHALWTNFRGVVDVLYDIIESTEFNADCVAAAESRIRDICNFKFILGLAIWNEVLSQIDLANKDLQQAKTDVSFAEKKLNVLLTWLQVFKNEGFTNCYEKAKLVANDLGIEIDCEFLNKRRGRGVNPKYDDPEKVAAARSMTNLERFKQDFFNQLLDRLISEMSQRFKQIKMCAENFGFLWGEGLNNARIDALLSAHNLALKYPDDLDEVAFTNEIKTFAVMVEQFRQKDQSTKKLSPLDVLNIIYKNKLESTYPNCAVALRIFLTLPVSVAHNERSFSKLKLIKNYLRSTMGQERLTALAIISIERELANTIDFDQIITDFAAVKCRKIDV